MIRNKLRRCMVVTCLVYLANFKVTAADSVDDLFRSHVIEETNRGSDELSSRKTRNIRLYSKVTSKHVQILGKKVTALGDDKDPYSKLLVISDSLGGRVRIRGEKSKYYLCMTPNGRVVGRKRFLGNQCTFVEGLTVKYYNIFSNAAYPNWYLSFNRRGRPKKGPKTGRDDTGSFFVKRSPPQLPQPRRNDELNAALKILEEKIRLKYQQSMYERSWRRIRRHRFTTETPVPMTKRSHLSESRKKKVEPPMWLFSPAADMSPEVKMEWLQNVNLYLDDKILNIGSSYTDPTMGPYTEQQLAMATKRRNKNKNSSKKQSTNKRRKTNFTKSTISSIKRRHHRRKQDRKSRKNSLNISKRNHTREKSFGDLLSDLREKLDKGHVINVPKKHSLFTTKSTTKLSTKSLRKTHLKYKKQSKRIQR